MSNANGYVPTPAPVADYAAAATFAADRPGADGRLLLPGLGTGNLYDAVCRYCTAGEGWTECRSFDYDLPECVGVEADPDRVDAFNATHPDAGIDIQQGDFLLEPPDGEFDWVLANPPFVRYRTIDAEKRDRYRDRFRTADGQFDLFVPFLEQSLRLLKPGGQLMFFLPVSALLNGMFESLRWEIRDRFAGPIAYLPPESFDAKVETVLVGLENRRSASSHLWLEELYEYEVRELLTELEVDDVDAAVDRYYEEYEHTRRTLRRRDARERKSGGGSATAVDSGRQSSLELFSGGASP